MQVAEFNQIDFSAQKEADKQLLVKFKHVSVQDIAESDKQGRPIYKEVEYVDIKIPGNRNTGACRPATPADKKRFAEHYERFKQRIEQDPNEGTLLSEWPVINRSVVEELSFFNVKTVEQLANMADVQVGQFMGLYELQAKARQWLNKAAKDTDIYSMSRQIKELKVQNDQLKDEVRNLVDAIHAETAGKTTSQIKQQKNRAAKGAKRALTNPPEIPDDEEVPDAT